MLFSDQAISILILALIIDRIIGDPDWLWSRLKHPVVLFGFAIGWLDNTLNRPDMSDPVRRRNGVIAIVGLAAAAVLIGAAITLLTETFSYFAFLETVLVSMLIAQKSLIDHVQTVADRLQQAGVKAGREAVSRIVGRDVNAMQEADISRAAIESAAENFSDGTVAPVLFYLIFGLPGLLVYKLVNTADSMIGHKNENYLQFGFASARLDDFLNYFPARISAGLIALAAPLQGGSLIHAGHIIARDASSHASPNAGWPEAATAAALDIALGGPRSYGNRKLQAPWLNASGERKVSHVHINAALGLIGTAWLFMLIALIAAQLLMI